MIKKLQAYRQLIRFDKPIGTLLVLWPTLWALIIASDGQPNMWILFVFIFGCWLMRSAGCAINDFADRKVDGFVERTNSRPLPAGLVSAKEAIAIFVIFSLFSFALVLTLNALTILLSLAALSLAFIYPFIKRISNLPQLILGLAFSWGIPMAFAAQTNQIPNIAWLLLTANVAWTIAYDTLYAMVDKKDDLKIGIKSSAILFGRHVRFIIMLLQLLTIAILIFVGIFLELGAIYYIGLLCVLLLFSHQQWLIKDEKEAACFKAFLNNNYVGMVICIALVFDYLF